MARSNVSVVLAGIALTCVSPLSSAVLCVRHESGALAARQTCKVNETQIDPANLGLQGPPGASLRVQDSNDKFVAPLVDPLTETAARGVGDQTILFSITESGFRASNVLYVAFGSADCSGDPYIYPDPLDGTATLTRRARVGLNLTMAYYPKPPLGLTAIRSTLEFSINDPEICLFDGGTYIPPYGCCRTQPAFDQIVWSAGTLDISEFKPPFHVIAP